MDADTEAEAAAPVRTSDSPEDVFEMKERHCRLCRALNSLPEIQGRRVEAHFLLGQSRKEIAAAEGVCESSVNESIDRGLREMKKIMRNFENRPVKCPSRPL
jgi:RNA polymerase sigma-70 factor (ECF subfamily)